MMLQNYFVLSFKWRNLMEDFAIIGFIFGLASFAKVVHLEKTLKTQCVLNKDYKSK